MRNWTMALGASLFVMVMGAVGCGKNEETPPPQTPPPGGQPGAYPPGYPGAPPPGYPQQPGYPPATQPGYPPPATQPVPGQPGTAVPGTPAPGTGLAVPGPAAFPCQNDSQCMTHKCNTQYGKCAHPCETDNDCITGAYCFKGPVPTCLPKAPGQQ